MSEQSIRVLMIVSAVALIFSVISLILIHRMKAIRLLGCKLSVTGDQNRLIKINDSCNFGITLINPTSRLVRIMISGGTLSYQHKRYNIQSKYVELPANSMQDISCDARLSYAMVKGKYGGNACEVIYQYSPPGMWKSSNKMYSEVITLHHCEDALMDEDVKKTHVKSLHQKVVKQTGRKVIAS